MLEEAEMRRLAMIQYMYTQAVEQVSKPEPLNMLAVLTFHDAVELFLALAAEHLNVGKEDQKFVTYWDVINPVLPNKDFGQRASMTRLNKARVGWKHYGIQIPGPDIESFHSSVTDFFQENTPKVFGIAFDEIAMAMLVQDEDVRDLLLKAEKLNSSSDLKAAIKEISIAFLILFHGFEWNAMRQNSIHLRGVSRRTSPRIEHEAPKELSRFAREIEKEISTLHEQVRLLSLGIDYRRYMRFKSLTPTAVLYMSGKYETLGNGKAQYHQDFLFCYSFVIECALRLQEIRFV
ncbi:hypothetical protein [Ktedonospora formicarum]|uniref:Uncharacterized protein n=1 Tax=Ktedonospora formicarum TaxID=2778364 RepID=A0A8J3IET0_9CHLR|nr:hypothetical protein [Ktedonospora formicarum]GHO51442.1 hypothetical protein KSX_96050 [Ktedonospora formicarum]